MKTRLQRFSQYISKDMGVTQELPAKIASYHRLPRVTSKIKKIDLFKVNSFLFSW